MSLYDEPKIDCHNHIFDPVRFPYAADTFYRPAGQEIGTAAQFLRVLDAHGVHHALLVGPNSGYGTDNRCMLDAIAQGAGRFKGIAVVANDVPLDELERLKRGGVVGVAFNPSLHGVEPYLDTDALLAKLAALDLCVQVQVEHNQLVALAPRLADCGLRVLIDHCGRPSPEAGLDQPGFRALLDLARTGRVCVKLSGYVKFSREPYPYTDAWPYVHALLDTFTPDACVWGSDWPFLRAPERIDYGPLLTLVTALLPRAEDRARVLWHTPRRLFGFGA